MLGEVTQVVFGLLGFPGYLGFRFVAVNYKLEASLPLQHGTMLWFFTLHQ